jgi:protein ImuA
MPGDGRSERVNFLRAEIASIERQGLRLPARSAPSRASGPALSALLNGGLARGALHEVLAASPGDLAAAAGFALALAIRFARERQTRPILWITEDFACRENGALYGPGLIQHGLDPSDLVIVQAANAKEALWGLEEAVKCRAPAAVIGEIWSLAQTYDLTASRRLLLAAQKGGTPCLLFAAGLSGAADQLSSSADMRFEIRAGPSPQRASAGRMPLPGLAHWSVRIAKARASPMKLDRTLFRSVLWDHLEASFRDAHSLSLAAVSADGSHHSRGARRRARQGA